MRVSCTHDVCLLSRYILVCLQLAISRAEVKSDARAIGTNFDNDTPQILFREYMEILIFRSIKLY